MKTDTVPWAPFKFLCFLKKGKIILHFKYLYNNINNNRHFSFVLKITSYANILLVFAYFQLLYLKLVATVTISGNT